MSEDSSFTDFLATSSGWMVLAFAGLAPAGVALLSPAAGALVGALMLTLILGVWLRYR
jgi:hypothetical protein